MGRERFGFVSEGVAYIARLSDVRLVWEWGDAGIGLELVNGRKFLTTTYDIGGFADLILDDATLIEFLS